MANTALRRVTLRDIAEATGYTVNTVSRALKNKPDISAATCARIQEVAEKMGYIRNEMAGSLRLGHTKTLGLVLGAMSNPYYAKMTDDIQDAATAQGYTISIFCSRDEFDQETAAIETALQRQVDGILIFPHRESQPTLDKLSRMGIPYVLMARYLRPGQADCVVCDEEQGGYLATRHLIEAGRRPAFLSHFDAVYSSEKRLEGFFRACREAGIPDGESHCAIWKSDENMLRQILVWKKMGIDGLFAFCDQEAWALESLLLKNGMRVPEDFAMVGFDNVQGSLKLPFSICSVDYDRRAMAFKGVELLIRRIQGDASPFQTAVFPTHIVCRESCRRPAAFPSESV